MKLKKIVKEIKDDFYDNILESGFQHDDIIEGMKQVETEIMTDNDHHELSDLYDFEKSYDNFKNPILMNDKMSFFVYRMTPEEYETEFDDVHDICTPYELLDKSLIVVHGT